MCIILNWRFKEDVHVILDIQMADYGFILNGFTKTFINGYMKSVWPHLDGTISSSIKDALCLPDYEPFTLFVLMRDDRWRMWWDASLNLLTTRCHVYFTRSNNVIKHVMSNISFVTSFFIANLRYMGTITGIGDLDPVRWTNSHWRSVKVIVISLMRKGSTSC